MDLGKMMGSSSNITTPNQSSDCIGQSLEKSLVNMGRSKKVYLPKRSHHRMRVDHQESRIINNVDNKKTGQIVSWITNKQQKESAPGNKKLIQYLAKGVLRQKRSLTLRTVDA